jgi:hypothetical protein
MSSANLFEAAARGKYRFPYNGSVSVEDLWDLSVEKLDFIYQALEAQADAAPKKSLLTAHTASNQVLANKIEIVKHIVSVKLAEAEARKQAAADKEYRQIILALIDEKYDEALRSLSVEELKKLAGIS